jgi:DNA-binding LacI/PurR family transcriptional regulator
LADQARRAAPAGGPSTANDVASAAGVSRQTVANVIHAPHRVRPETRQRVERFIAELGYRPNRVAQALRFNASRIIGYRIEPLATGALATIHDRFLHALAEAGREADRHFLVYTAQDAAAEIAAAERLHRSGSADAFVLYNVIADDPRPAALLALGVPFVAFGRTEGSSGRAEGEPSRTEDGSGRTEGEPSRAEGDPGDGYPWVDVDNVAGVGAVVDHLVQRGHRRIAFVGWPDGITIGDRRARGWHAAIERHGLLAECGALDARCEDSVTAAAEQAFRLLSHPEPPTAFVTATDTLAVGVLRASQRWGLEVGRDVAIVGFDDTPTAAAFDLSSVRQPIELAGQQIMAMLLGGDSGGELLQPQLIIRPSSAAPARFNATS